MKSLQTVQLAVRLESNLIFLLWENWALSIVERHILIPVFFSSTVVLKLLKTAEGIRKLLDTVAEALPQVSGLKCKFSNETATLPLINHFVIDLILRALVPFQSSIRNKIEHVTSIGYAFIILKFTPPFCLSFTIRNSLRTETGNRLNRSSFVFSSPDTGWELRSIVSSDVLYLCRLGYGTIWTNW